MDVWCLPTEPVNETEKVSDKTAFIDIFDRYALLRYDFGSHTETVYAICLLNMETMNSSYWTNGSNLLYNVSNDSFGITENNPTHKAFFSNFVLYMCVLGLPGNLLVIAVNARKMTTSTRVYMFALGVTDSAVCLSGIVMSTALMNLITTLLFMFAISTSIIFSMFLLVFVSIERLIAVRHPHSFNMKSKRAKKALLIIAMSAVVYTTLTLIAGIKQYKQFNRVSGMCVQFGSVLIMVTCYTIMATTLVIKARASRNRIATVNMTASSDQGSSHMFRKVKLFTFVDSLVRKHKTGAASVTKSVDNSVCPVDPGPSNVLSKQEYTSDVNRARTNIPEASTSTHVNSTTKTVARQTKTFSNITLLFIITVVFIVCWLPQWLYGAGVHIAVEARRVFVLNSVVNPFIYGVASAMFREDVRQFYHCTRVKLSACCC